MSVRLRLLIRGVFLGLPVVAAWGMGVLQSTKAWLAILIATYLLAPRFGVEPLTFGQLLDFVLQKPDSWVAIITLVVAVVAAGSFLASKRLDMRLAAADDIQRLQQELVNTATEWRAAAESLAAFRSYAARFPRGVTGLDAGSEIRQVGASVLTTVPRVSKAQGRIWDILKDAHALRSRHRLALSNNSVCIVAFDNGLAKLDELASIPKWLFPLEPEKLNDLYDWAADPRSEWVDGYSAVNLKLSQGANVCFGASAGAVAGMLFPTSAAAAWVALRGVLET